MDWSSGDRPPSKPPHNEALTMITAMFQPEISNLKSQVAQLQAQIEEFNHAQFVADNAISALKDAVGSISQLSVDAIGRLKSAVWDLFDGGTQEPQQLNGEACEINPEAYWDSVSPDGSYWELATPIACLIEQEYSEPEQSLFRLIEVSATTAYMRKQDGEICCAYVGGNNKNNLRRWGEFLTVSHSCGNKFELRTAKRIPNWKWELKIWGVSLVQIEKLSTCDISKDPHSAFPDAPIRRPEIAPATYSENLEQQALDSIQPPPPTAAIVDINDVPSGVTLTPIRDDLLISFDVWMLAEVRVMGRPQRQQKQIGRLTETSVGIEARRPRASGGRVFNRTLDAVAYLIGGGIYRPVVQHQHQEDEILVSVAEDDDDF